LLRADQLCVTRLRAGSQGWVRQGSLSLAIIEIRNISRAGARHRSVNGSSSIDLSEEAVNEIKRVRRMLLCIVLLLLGVVIYFAKDILMPIMLGFLIALTLTPVVRRLVRIGVPAALAAIVVVLSITAIIGSSVYALSEPFGEMMSTVPEIGENLRLKLLPFQATINDITEASKQVQTLAPDANDETVQQVLVERRGLLTAAASTLASGVTSIAVALLLSTFILGSGTLFYEKLVTFMPQLSEKKRALRIVYDVESSVSHYLFTITLINMCLGLCIGMLLYAVDFENPALWGVIAMLLNFLPILGALMGSAFLAVMSIGIYDSLLTALIPPMIYLSCSIFEGNVLTPLIVGRRLQLNVVAVFLTVAVWAWLWGLAGALMAVPVLVVINVLCDHVDGWKPLGHFLSGHKEKATGIRDGTVQ